MTHRLPNKPPSAIDGYRRLARTRTVNVPSDVSDVVIGTTAVRTARGRSARVVGALRLAAFVAVLTMIVGTSVGLASSQTRDSTPPTPDSAPTPTAAEPVTVEATSTTVTEPTELAPAPRAAARQVVAGEQLPFTGPHDIERMILFGAVLVFFGMLVQIAGQPLPASRR